MQTITLSHDTLADGAGHTFQRDPPPREEPPQRRKAKAMTLFGQRGAQFYQGDVGRRLHQAKDQRRLCLDPP